MKKALLSSCLVIWTLTLSAAPSSDSRPNILIILADDLGRADVGFAGGKEIQTPNLDKLASAGAVLDQYYVQPLCSPTRAALMTGRYPMRYGFQVGVVKPWEQRGLPLEERILPRVLKESGYTTGVVGKWHLGHFSREYLPTQRGFDHQYGHYNGQLGYFSHVRDGGFDWHRNDKECRDEGYSTHLIAREAVQLITSYSQKKPFFLYVPFNAVHSPHEVPDSYKEPYRSLPEPRRTYAGMLAAMDEAVGQIDRALEDTGLKTNTFIIFSSDNGGPSPGRVTDNGPLRGGKGTLFEGGVRVCAFATWAGHIRAGSVISAPFHVVDWYPTLLKLAGASLEQKLALDGQDIWPLLSGGRGNTEREILLNSTPTAGAIRVGDWKYITYGAVPEDQEPKAGSSVRKRKATVEGQQEMLFNIAEDPNETRNLASDKPAKLAQIKDRYDRLKIQAVKPGNQPQPAGWQSPRVWGETDTGRKSD